MPVDLLGFQKSEYTEDIRQAPLDELVCFCSGISKGRILEEIDSGARTLADIKEVTGACTVAKCKEMNPRGR